MSFNKRNKGVNPLFGSTPQTQVYKQFIRDLNIAGSFAAAGDVVTSGSLSANGDIATLDRVLTATGSFDLPAHSFVEYTGSGMYLDPVIGRWLGFSYDAELMWHIDRFGNWISDSDASVRAGDGSEIRPAYAFASDTGTGMRYEATGILRFTTSQSDAMSIDADGNIVADTMQQYVSVHLIQGNTLQSGEFNPFDSGSYGGIGVTNARNGVSSADGRFSVVKAGDYKISGIMFFHASANTLLQVFKIRKNNTTDIWVGDNSYYVTTNANAAGFDIITTLASDDFIEIKADSAAGTVQCLSGTCINICRIA